MRIADKVEKDAAASVCERAREALAENGDRLPAITTKCLDCRRAVRNYRARIRRWLKRKARAT